MLRPAPDTIDVETQRAQEELLLLETFAKNLNAALDDCGYSDSLHGRAKILSEHFPVSIPGARKWLSAKAMPTPVTLARISAFVGWSIDQLFGLTSPAAGGRDEPPVYKAQVRTKDKETVSALLLTNLGGASHAIQKLRGSVADGFILSWTRIDELNCRKGDTLLGFDTTVRSIEDGAYYLLRYSSGDLVFRRAFASSTGEIQLGLDGIREVKSIKPNVFKFNESRTLEETEASGILVIGKLVSLTSTLT